MSIIRTALYPMRTILPILILAMNPIPTMAQTQLFVNAQVISLDAAFPNANAVLVRDGKIARVGLRADLQHSLKQTQDSKYTTVDLDGATLAPSFIDAHGHLSLTLLTQSMVNVSSPPVGSAENVDDIIELLKQRRAPASSGTWIIGFGYDDSLLEEQRHLTKFDLDQVSRTQPVAVLHVSGHFISCNSRCLELAEIDRHTPNPSGGVIRRVAKQEPNGVLEETAMYAVYAQFPKADETTKDALLKRALEHYASFGITTVQDGAASPADVLFLKSAAERGLLNLDVVAYPFQGHYGKELERVRSQENYKNNFRVGGIKLVLDGSPQGKTAWLSEPYLHPPHGQGKDYAGYPTLAEASVNDAVSAAFAENTQVIAHANGDAASDQLLRAVARATDAHGQADRRTVMIHAQTVREDQIARMRTLKVMPSYFSAHAYYWGDWHRDSVLGAERASRISPLQSSLQQGLRFSTHNDTPIVPPDMLRLMWASVNRLTRSGAVLGAAQSISPEQALRSITIDAAYQYFEESSKGSLSPGKLADMVVLSHNPLTVEPQEINQIKVLATYKEGQLVYAAEAP